MLHAIAKYLLLISALFAAVALINLADKGSLNDRVWLVLLAVAVVIFVAANTASQATGCGWIAIVLLFTAC